MNRFDIAGRVALVTGASSGLGLHFATTLARAGAPVAVCARRIDRLAELCESLAAEGLVAQPFAMDVTDGASVEAALDAAVAHFGRLDVVVNNAGIGFAKPALDVEEEEWDRVIDTNLRGAWLVARGAARRMRTTGGGSLINIASITGIRTTGQLTAYGAAKAGLLHLTRNLALELARDGIRVNAIAPGYIETELNREFFATPAGEALIRRIPQRRLGRLPDLEGPLLLLASDASAYMTGAVLAVDGGHLQSGL